MICDRNVFNSSESADNGPNFDDSSESDLRMSSQDQTTVRARPPTPASGEIDFGEKSRVLSGSDLLGEIKAELENSGARVENKASAVNGREVYHFARTTASLKGKLLQTETFY